MRCCAFADAPALPSCSCPGWQFPMVTTHAYSASTKSPRYGNWKPTRGDVGVVLLQARASGGPRINNSERQPRRSCGVCRADVRFGTWHARAALQKFASCCGVWTKTHYGNELFKHITDAVYFDFLYRLIFPKQVLLPKVIIYIILTVPIECVYATLIR